MTAPRYLGWLTCLAMASLLAADGVSKDNPIAATKNGQVRGLLTANGKVSAFLGIPYADPTTKENRFRKAQPVKDWEGIYDATSKPPICMQFSSNELPWLPKGPRSEDCLFLNVWTPVESTGTGKKRSSHLPVMVWIHGGGYYSGWSGEEFYDGATIAALGGVVVVSMNYRVGSFGFLTSVTEDAPGNIGLHDQLLALEWVKENIASFGGNPNSVTLFGESSGAVSVGMHMISPLSRNLFHKAIMQSGSPYHPELAAPSVISKFKSNLFAGMVGCSDQDTNLNTDPATVIKCLREKDAEELVKAEAKILERLPLFFLPTQGDDFIPINPITAINSGKYNKVPVLIGNNKDEGAIFMYQLIPQYFNATHAPVLNNFLGKALVSALFQNSTNPPPEVIAEFYMKDVDDDSDAIVKQVHRSFGDNIFVCPCVFFAEKMPEAYYYVFTHRPSNSLWGEWMGTTHFEDIPFVFGLPEKFPQLYTAEERTFSRDIISKWTTFAKTGVPCDGQDFTLWPTYTASNRCHKELYPNSFTIGHGFRTEACNFWRNYFVGK